MIRLASHLLLEQRAGPMRALAVAAQALSSSAFDAKRCATTTDAAAAAVATTTSTSTSTSAAASPAAARCCGEASTSHSTMTQQAAATARAVQRTGPLALHRGISSINGISSVAAVDAAGARAFSSQAAVAAAAEPSTSSAAASAAADIDPEGITLHDSAVERLKQLQASAAPGKDVMLRVEVEGGGCSGFQYKFRLETTAAPSSSSASSGASGGAAAGGGAPAEEGGASASAAAAAAAGGDRVFERGGARVVTDAVSLGFLKGSVIEFEDSLMRSAFHVASNPNSESSCGCGSSFVAKA